MTQLDLMLWPSTTVRGALLAYLEIADAKVRPATRVDYRERLTWLCRGDVFGEATPLAAVTYPVVEDVIRRWGPSGKGLLLVTLRKRLRTLRAAIVLAHERGLVDRVWRMPAQLRDDGERGQQLLEVAQYQAMRVHLGQRHRRACDLMFWTGIHPSDMRTLRRSQLDPDFVWRDDAGAELARGRYLRRNTKNEDRGVKPAWFPMEVELRALAAEWLAERELQWEQPLVGRVWGLHKAMARACDLAAVPRVTPKDLRRSFATMLAARGYAPEYIRQALGHLSEVAVVNGRVQRSAVTTYTRFYARPSSEFVRGSLAARAG